MVEDLVDRLTRRSCVCKPFGLHEQVLDDERDVGARVEVQLAVGTSAFERALDEQRPCGESDYGRLMSCRRRSRRGGRQGCARGGANPVEVLGDLVERLPGVVVLDAASIGPMEPQLRVGDDAMGIGLHEPSWRRAGGARHPHSGRRYALVDKIDFAQARP